MRGADIARQTVFIDRETVILARDHHLFGIEVHDGVIGAVMAEFHFRVFAPLASASSWWPRQIPKVGNLAFTSRLIASIA